MHVTTKTTNQNTQLGVTTFVAVRSYELQININKRPYKFKGKF